jgi:hypothetical protein
MRGNYLGSIRHYFGTGKEAFYLDESVKFFNERRIALGDDNSMIDDDEIFDVLS